MCTNFHDKFKQPGLQLLLRRAMSHLLSSHHHVFFSVCPSSLQSPQCHLFCSSSPLAVLLQIHELAFANHQQGAACLRFQRLSGRTVVSLLVVPGIKKDLNDANCTKEWIHSMKLEVPQIKQESNV
jgi:hypothetical protein